MYRWVIDMSVEHHTFGPWDAESYTFTFSKIAETTVFAFEPAITVEAGGDVRVTQDAPVVESYSFFWPGIQVNEFQSGSPGAKGDPGDPGDPGPPGEDGVGIPEVFIDGAPATLNFSSIEIDGQTVYQMQVVPS